MVAVNYRNATQQDLVTVVEIYNSTIASRMVTADTEPVTVESKQPWFEEHTPNKRPLWIIENENKEIIGWISFQSFYGRPAYDATAEISIYLDASQRGKGLGKQVLQYCLTTAPQLGIKTLVGFIFAHNEPSLKLFTHLGFKEWGNLPNIALLDGEERGLKILGKRIVL
jgi:L-amino acid N-acyltransferase YncA